MIQYNTVFVFLFIFIIYYFADKLINRLIKKTHSHFQVGTQKEISRDWGIMGY